MIAEAARGLSLGLATGVYCLGSCALVLAPYLATREDAGLRRSLRDLLAFSGGRLVGYVLLAALALALGSRLPQGPALRNLTGVAMVVLAALVLAYSLGLHFGDWRPCSRLAGCGPVRRFPLVAGFLAALRPCPPLLLCLTAAVAARGVFPGLALLLGFFAGSSVFLAPLLGAGGIGRWASLRGFAEVAAIFSALWFLASGLTALTA